MSDKARTPLLRRAMWHALKTLVRRHPGAALTAAGAGVSYAAKEAVEEVGNKVRAVFAPSGEATGAEAITGSAMDDTAAASPADEIAATSELKETAPMAQLSDAQKEELIASLGPKELKELERLAALRAEKS